MNVNSNQPNTEDNSLQTVGVDGREPRGAAIPAVSCLAPVSVAASVKQKVQIMKKIFITKDKGTVIGHQIAAPPHPSHTIPRPGSCPVVASGAAAAPASVQQKVSIVKSADNKLYVLGLLPGQQLVQMPDGRLQIFSNLPVEDLTAASPSTGATNTAAPTENSPLVTLTRDSGLRTVPGSGGPEGDLQSVSNISLASSSKTTAHELKRKYDSIETKIQEGKSNVEERSVALLESTLETSTESIKANNDVGGVKNNNNVVKPKCHICFGEMSTKIAQCISGHLLCWPCKEKMGDKNCAFCDQPVNGRAFGMEAYLRTIFG